MQEVSRTTGVVSTLPQGINQHRNLAGGRLVRPLATGSESSRKQSLELLLTWPPARPRAEAQAI